MSFKNWFVIGGFLTFAHLNVAHAGEARELLDLIPNNGKEEQIGLIPPQEAEERSHEGQFLINGYGKLEHNAVLYTLRKVWSNLDTTLPQKNMDALISRDEDNLNSRCPSICGETKEKMEWRSRCFGFFCGGIGVFGGLGCIFGGLGLVVSPLFGPASSGLAIGLIMSTMMGGMAVVPISAFCGFGIAELGSNHAKVDISNFFIGLYSHAIHAYLEQEECLLDLSQDAKEQLQKFKDDLLGIDSDTQLTSGQFVDAINKLVKANQTRDARWEFSDFREEYIGQLQKLQKLEKVDGDNIIEATLPVVHIEMVE